MQCQRLNSFICIHCISSAGDQERCSVCRKDFRLYQYRAICNICSSLCHLACTQLARNNRDKLKTGGKQWSCCSRRPVNSQPSQSCCCCRPHSTNVLPAESSTRNHVAASSLSPQVARKGSTLSGFVQRSRLEREVGRDLHSNKWEEV